MSDTRDYDRGVIVMRSGTEFDVTVRDATIVRRLLTAGGATGYYTAADNDGDSHTFDLEAVETVSMLRDPAPAPAEDETEPWR